MEDQKLYTTLFNAVTDALRALDNLDVGSAKEILLHAQLTTEGMFIAGGGQREPEKEGRSLTIMEKLGKLNARLDHVESMVKIHEREIEELKKKLSM